MPFSSHHLFPKISQKIAPGDGMYTNGNEAHYFSVGASAISVIHDALETAKLPDREIRRVLDYACGYGRVLRWLKAAFPGASLLGVDADPKAAAMAASVIGVETRPLDISLAQPLDEPFDLIWVGSLFTHLSEQEANRVLRYLKEHLTTFGLLVFTTHGAIVEHRLSSRERDYNLAGNAIDRLLDMLRQSGYGFHGYAKMENYGISVARPSKIVSMIENCGLKPVLFRDRGWADHQDVYACLRA